LAKHRNNRRRRSGGKRKKRSNGNRQPEDSGKLYFEGVVEKALPGTQFWVRCDNGMLVLAYLAGKMRRFRIRLLPGDRVNLDVSAYDPTRGRITYRHRTPRPYGARAA